MLKGRRRRNQTWFAVTALTAAIVTNNPAHSSVKVKSAVMEPQDDNRSGSRTASADTDTFFDISDWSDEEKRTLYDTATEIHRLKDSLTLSSNDQREDEQRRQRQSNDIYGAVGNNGSPLRGKSTTAVRHAKQEGFDQIDDPSRNLQSRTRIRRKPTRRRRHKNTGKKGSYGKKNDYYDDDGSKGYDDSKGYSSKGQGSKGYYEDDGSKGYDVSKGYSSKGYDMDDSKGSKGQPTPPRTARPTTASTPMPTASPPTGGPVPITISPAPSVSPAPSRPPIPAGDFVRCFNEGNAVKCPDPSLAEVCDKYALGGLSSFRDCFGLCKEAFCCIHDSQTNRSPSCSAEQNCQFYTPCYIVWWKLHDTIGPAPYVRLDQDEDFYDYGIGEFEQELINDQDFFAQFFGHHFLTDDIIPLTDDTFEDPANWGS